MIRPAKQAGRLTQIGGAAALLTFYLNTPLWSAGQTAAESLLAGFGARPAALGGAYTAIANDPFAMAYNPSGLAAMRRPMISLMHSEWLQGARQQFAALGLPMKMGAIGISFYRMDMGNFAGRDMTGAQTNSFTAGDLSLGLSFARAIHRRVLAGLKMTYFRQDLAGYQASTAFGDAGLLVAASKKLTIGAAIQNAGPGLRFIEESSPLPLTYALGAGYNLGGIRTTMDYKIRPHEGSGEFAAGAEISPMAGAGSRPLTLRLGYAGSAAALKNQTLGGLGAGFGLALGVWGFDYAYQPFGILGATHRMSVTIKL